MKLLNFVAYLFYRYYSKGKTYGMEYINTIAALVMLSFLNVFAVLIIFNGTAVIPLDKEHRGATLLKGMIFICPWFLLFVALIRKKTLEALTYSPKVIKRGNFFLISYIVASIALIVLLIYLKKGIRSVTHI